MDEHVLSLACSHFAMNSPQGHHHKLNDTDHGASAPRSCSSQMFRCYVGRSRALAAVYVQRMSDSRQPCVSRRRPSSKPYSLLTHPSLLPKTNGHPRLQSILLVSRPRSHTSLWSSHRTRCPHACRQPRARRRSSTVMYTVGIIETLQLQR